MKTNFIFKCDRADIENTMLSECPLCLFFEKCKSDGYLEEMKIRFRVIPEDKHDEVCRWKSTINPASLKK